MSLARYGEYKDSGVEWLGDVPSHWSLDRLKRSTKSCRNGIWGEEACGDANDIPCVRVADFDRQRLRVVLEDPTIRNVPTRERSARLLIQGDLLLEKSGGGENQPVGCVVLYDDERDAICSNFVARIEVADDMSPSFWRYVHASAYTARINTASIKQTSGIQNLDQQSYFDERAAFPPIKEQVAIASFLDHETAKIDTLVAEQEKLISLLKEKRQALISHAVTKGLNPNAPMKPSGIEWLGDVPAHWSLVRLKDCGCSIVDCKNRTPEEFPDGEYFVVRTSCVKDGQFAIADGFYTDEANFMEWTKKGRPKAGDILFTREAPTGEACLAPENLDFCLGQRMMYIRPRERSLSSQFLLHAIYSGIARERIDLKSKGSTVGHLRVGEVGELPLLLPPLREQEEITAFLSINIAKIDELKSEAMHAMSLLKERRSALISAAVTGKIDVRGVDLAKARAESREDIAAGRFVVESVEAHMTRVGNTHEA